MTKYGSPDVAFFLIDGLNVVGDLTEFDDRLEARTERSDALGSSWEEHSFINIRNGEITQSGFYDDEVGKIHDALSSGPGATAILCYGVEGTVSGQNFVGWAGGVQVNYERLFERDGLTKARASYRSKGEIDQGKILHTYKAVAATGEVGSVETATVSSTGAVGYLQYNATAGEANIRIKHSSDDVTYADLIVFTKTASGHAAERVSATGVVERYTAVDFTTASATGSITDLSAFVGIVRISSSP